MSTLAEFYQKQEEEDTQRLIRSTNKIYTKMELNETDQESKDIQSFTKVRKSAKERLEEYMQNATPEDVIQDLERLGVELEDIVPTRERKRFAFWPQRVHVEYGSKKMVRIIWDYYISEQKFIQVDIKNKEVLFGWVTKYNFLEH